MAGKSGFRAKPFAAARRDGVRLPGYYALARSNALIVNLTPVERAWISNTLRRPHISNGELVNLTLKERGIMADKGLSLPARFVARTAKNRQSI